MHTRNRFTSIVALAMGAVLVFASATLADQLEGDEITPVRIAGTLGFGTVCAGVATPQTLSLAIRRIGGGGETYVNGTAVTITSVSASAGLSAGAPSGTITMPSDWQTATTGTLSSSVTATVTLNTSALGAYNGTVTYQSSGTRVNGMGPWVDTDAIPVTANVVDCAPADSTPPVITPNVLGTLGSNGWHTSNVTVSWTVVDEESDITSTTGCGPTTINTDTVGQTITCSATSAGGTDSNMVTIKRDATGPAIIPGNVINTTWRNSSLSEDFTASDATSGLASAADAAFTLTASVESSNASTPTVASRTVTDLAGNSSTRSVSALIDLTNPTIGGNVSPASPDGTNGWYKSPPTVTFSCNDTLSGMQSCLADGESTNARTLGESANAQSVSGTATDAAGNTASTTVSGLKVDLSNPGNIEFVGGPSDGSSHYFGSVPPAPTCTADDAVSGLASCVVTGHSGAVGNHTLTATATDNAGRTAIATRTYSVLAWDLSGLYKPVDMGGVWNSAKGGSTIPLKFEVFAGANELKDVSAVSSLAAKKVACPNASAVTEEVEMLSSGSTALRFDTVGDQFIYNWKTPAGAGCYEVKVSTADGSSVTAFFNLRK